MKETTELGSRIAEVHNGSSLFTGDAGQGESNARRYLIERDLVEAIIALPENVFRRISLQGNEIEIFEEQDDSYFDKYLNEVLYLFENVEADVIVFEDMDRFNAIRIFERLREVNTLVNIQRKKEHGDKYVPLWFFYL